MAVSLAMLTVTAALQGFACLFIFYHAADRKSDRCCNHQQPPTHKIGGATREKPS